MLYYIDDVYDENIYSKINFKWLAGNKHEDILKDILSSIEWAIKNPAYDFRSILKGLVFVEKRANIVMKIYIILLKKYINPLKNTYIKMIKIY